MNMILGKRQILLGVLAVALGTAVYINWSFTKDAPQEVPTNQSSETESYGDAKYVATNETDVATTSSTNSSSSAYFTEARFNRQSARDTAVETLQDIFKDTNMSQTEKDDAIKKANSVTAAIDSEVNIENLIKAKGFNDCVAFIDDEKASIVVKSDGLIDSDVAKIKEIVMTQGNVLAENISIVEVK